jgi:hypothetical protein
MVNNDGTLTESAIAFPKWKNMANCCQVSRCRTTLMNNLSSVLPGPSVARLGHGISPTVRGLGTRLYSRLFVWLERIGMILFSSYNLCALIDPTKQLAEADHILRAVRFNCDKMLRNTLAKYHSLPGFALFLAGLLQHADTGER